MLSFELQVVECLVLWLATWCWLHCPAPGKRPFSSGILVTQPKSLMSSSDLVLRHSICYELADFSVELSIPVLSLGDKRLEGRRGCT